MYMYITIYIYIYIFLSSKQQLEELNLANACVLFRLFQGANNR